MSDRLADRGTITVTSHQWDQVASLFDAALALPPALRESYVQARCTDPSVLREVRGLFAVHSPEPGVLERVMRAVAPRDLWRVDLPRGRAGPYELLREIGRGGMGVVYLARRADGLYQRQVALKLARSPMRDAAGRARFLAERDILAGLAHPHIAQLFDAGVTEDGLPYFTMEFVDGVPIDVYCDTHRLTVRARLRLFLDVCAAVAAAHRALVVHRDLKPTNVLVTTDGKVKLVDFGIAKLLEPVGTAAVQETAPDARLMTPAYASPEQVLAHRVSTATDVYALGLLLYELLSGRRAHLAAAVPGRDLANIVAYEDPPSMTQALRSGVRQSADSEERVGPDASAISIAEARRTTVRRLARDLRGDLARITTKALQKHPDDRYATASQLAEDIERYLSGRPVIARGHSLSYRAMRFARRHRLALATAAMGMLALSGYLALAVQHAANMEQIAAREREEARRATEISEFVVSLFEAGDPDVVQSRDASIPRVLEQGIDRAAALAGQPLVQARMLNAIGRVYFNLGRFREASDVAAKALAASRSGGGDVHPDVARDHRLLGLSAGALGDQRTAAEHFRSALEIRQLTEGSRTTEVAADQHHLGYALAQLGELDESEKYITASLQLRRALLPGGHEDVAMSLSGLAFLRGRQGRPRESVTLYRDALAIRINRLGPRHPEVARARQNLGSMLSTAGEFDEAARELALAIEVYRHAYGDSHPSIATTLNNLGSLEARRSRVDRAIRYFREAFTMRTHLLGRDHPSTVLAQINLASALARRGDLAEGERVLRDVLHRTAGRDDIAMGGSRPQTMANLAHVLWRRGKLDEAEALCREALALITRTGGSPLVEASIRSTLSLTLRMRRRTKQAEDMLQRALDIRRERLGPEHPDVVRTRRDLENLRAGRPPVR